jgi:hypothetical protein
MVKASSITSSDSLYSQRMDTSLKGLEEALSIRRQIGTLEKRLASILESFVPNRSTLSIRRGMSAATKAKLSAAAKARWAKRKRGVSAATRKKGGLTPAGRKRLSQLMKARWAARKKAARQK